MKKVVLAVISTVCVATAAQAQSPRVEVAVTSSAWNGAFAKPKKTTVAHPRTQQRNATLERMVLQQVEQAKHATQQVAVKPAKPVSRPVETAQKTESGNVGQWLKAIFLGGRFPGESAQAYHDRLVAQSHPAALPFK